MRIFLIGFMGSGKSSLGKRLARRVGFDFLDLDNFIEEKTSKKIPNIIENNGEDVFRQIERDALLSMSDYDNIIIATGGGTPCFFDNMDSILKMGTSVYLKMSPASLAKRLQDSNHIRPLIKNKTGKELHEKVTELLNQREHHYLRANCIIKGENAKPEHIISLIFGQDLSF
ncbi:MAG: AAA family ATPase [Bacteroidetes bacterium]|nr:AAA family ATPase [Bacteroidota bacterium]